MTGLHLRAGVRPGLRRLAAVATVAFALLEGPARAQEGTVELYVDPALAATDREAVRSAVERDLGRPVRLVERVPHGDGLTVTKGKGGSARVAYRSGDRLTERAVDLPADPAERAQTIALLSGNVVRDEAAELLGELHAKDAAPAAADPTTPPVAPAPSPSPPPAKPAKARAAPRPAVAKPAPAEAEPEKRPELPPLRCIDPATADYVGGDFVPYVGLSSVRGSAGTRLASFNVIGGLTRGIYGGELGGVFNFTGDSTCGAQIAGIANVVSGTTLGLQLGGIASVTSGRLDGLQFGGIVSQTGDVVRGAQIAGIVNRAKKDVEGAQVAGLVNIAQDRVDGAQVGAVNVATGHARVQVGLVNVSESADAPIGLVSIVADGRTQAFASASSWGLVSAGLRHGNGFIHNVYGVGVLPFGDRARGALTAGVGVEAAASERATLDVDLLCHTIYSFRANTAPSTVTELRVPIGVKLGERFTLWGAPAYGVAVGDAVSEVDLNSFAVSTFDDGPSSFVRGFPSVTAGVMLEL